MKENLDQNQILMAEFQYASDTAHQANDDRGKVFEVFLANIVTLVSAAVLPSILNVDNKLIFVFVFIGLFMFGVITLFQLTRTRVAWVSSVKAMNQIKDYYIKHNKELENAFKWRVDSIPKANSKSSIIFAQSVSIMILNSLNVSLIIYFVFFFGFRLLYIPVLGIPFMICLALHFVIWERLLKK
ncbi:MAG: hypothetical protein ACMG57_04325 [Candidatus Dojkabacteria bacterium]